MILPLVHWQHRTAPSTDYARHRQTTRRYDQNTYPSTLLHARRNGSVTDVSCLEARAMLPSYLAPREDQALHLQHSISPHRHRRLRRHCQPGHRRLQTGLHRRRRRKLVCWLRKLLQTVEQHRKRILLHSWFMRERVSTSNDAMAVYQVVDLMSGSILTNLHQLYRQAAVLLCP